MLGERALPEFFGFGAEGCVDAGEDVEPVVDGRRVGMHGFHVVRAPDTAADHPSSRHPRSAAWRRSQGRDGVRRASIGRGVTLSSTDRS
ncbi:hypothetical protein AB0442_16825 [Kitasatospora sp. NPDC085895]|uniref:hypothetical protein n=1 Tax=Kitasatospora sp. NPDC085895 TaxID=3155057 RepID=UPI00344B64B3